MSAPAALSRTEQDQIQQELDDVAQAVEQIQRGIDRRSSR